MYLDKVGSVLIDLVIKTRAMYTLLPSAKLMLYKKVQLEYEDFLFPIK